MRILPSVLRQTIRAGFARCGYDLVNRQEFGRDWLTDAAAIGGAPPEMVFDVGANKGQCLGEMLKHFPRARIHSFEPFPEVFAQLTAMTRAYPNVTAHNLALGEADGTRAFHLNRASDTNSFLPNSTQAAEYAPPGWVDPMGIMQVPMRRLDTFCREQGIERIDLLKIDSQGYELKILEGGAELLRARRIRLLLLEVLFVPLYEDQPFFEDVYLHLKRRGCRLVGLYEQHREPSKALKWSDALFVAESG
jgi:FkbM family methyltransferase